MEHFDKVAIVPFKGAWRDVGGWNEVAELSPADENDNRLSGQGMAINDRSTYINSPHRPVVVLGTYNLVIVDTPDAVLVAYGGKLEEVKDIVVKLKKDGVSHAVMHRRVARPWAWYELIDMGERFQVKCIALKLGAKFKFANASLPF